VIDPRVGMSVPPADMHYPLDICPAPRPLTTSRTNSLQILSTTGNAILTPINAHAGHGFDLNKIPNEIMGEIFRNLLVFPGQVVHVSDLYHPTGEPVLYVGISGQFPHHGLRLPPLGDLLAVAATNRRCRHLAPDQFFRHNTFDLTWSHAFQWTRSLPRRYREQLTRVELSLYLGPVIFPEKKSIYAEERITIIGASHRLRSVTIKVRDPPTFRPLSLAEKQQMFLQLPELDLLSRLRGVDNFVVEALFPLPAADITRLQQCLAKPKGRRGSHDQPYLHPALALRPLSSDILVRLWSDLDPELESYGEDPANFSTKISKAKKLERLRRLDWKNPDEPDEP